MPDPAWLAAALAQQEDDKERQFRAGIEATPWFAEFMKQYGEPPDLRPGGDYDYRKAWDAGVRPERDPYDASRYHWPSSLPDGTMLKSPDHPTAWKEHYMRQYGVNPDAVGATEADWRERR